MEPYQLYVNEIFNSISGEVGGFPQGIRATFIRLAGCNLRCPYCDAPASQSLANHQKMTTNDIITQLMKMDYRYIDNIVITGGEPLLQLEVLEILIKLLLQMGKKITIETNGTIAPSQWLLSQKDVFFVVDYKLSEYGWYRSKVREPECQDLESSVFLPLRKQDFIKFVVADEGDIEVAIRTQKDLMKCGCQATFAYSALIPKNESTKAGVIIHSSNIHQKVVAALNIFRLNAVINIQLHKFLGFA